jgi:hypothetical protein
MERTETLRVHEEVAAGVLKVVGDTLMDKMDTT